jgi:hypothetical protein
VVETVVKQVRCRDDPLAAGPRPLYTYICAAPESACVARRDFRLQRAVTSHVRVKWGSGGQGCGLDISIVREVLCAILDPLRLVCRSLVLRACLRYYLAFGARM